jgi:hypothetical protein
VNFFPGVRSALHIFMESGASKMIKLLFESVNNGNKSHSPKVPFTIPIFEDINNRSPLDVAIENENPNLADVFLRGIKNYPFMSCGYILASGVIGAFNMELPFLGEFLDC